MPVRVKLVPEGRVVEVRVEGSVRAGALLRMLGLNPESAVVLRSGTPLTEDEEVRDGEEVEVVRVLSGGRPSPGA
ncbi:hypothetical protein JCM10135_00390 [Stetteria hydrogenophila]